jgi:hypothetical protein
MTSEAIFSTPPLSAARSPVGSAVGPPDTKAGIGLAFDPKHQRSHVR